MKLGAIHRDTPASIARLSQRASLSLMVPPARVDWHAACPADGDDLGNSQFGCCVPAAEFRAIQMRRAVVGHDAWKPTADETLALYSALTGFNATTGQPDVGTDTVAAMSAWCSIGIRVNSQDEDVPAWASVDPENIAHCQIAVAHLGPVQVTLSLPAALQDLSLWGKAPGSGAGWEPGSWGGHRVASGKYDGAVFVVRTWGQDIEMHPRVWSAYVVGVDATVSREWCDTTGLTPSGMDWAALVGDMARLVG